MNALLLTGARLIDATGAPVREDATVLVEDGRVARVEAGGAGGAREGGGAAAGATRLDLGGRTLMPGLVDAHVHVTSVELPPVRRGQEALAPEVKHHLIAAGLRRMVRMGITTVRDVGAYGDDLLHARQAIRLGAIPGPRVLVCGRILSATSPVGRHFAGMYREADGPEEMR